MDFRLILIVAEIIHGILRAIALVPMVGEFRSNQFGVFTGSAIILVISYPTIRWVGAKRIRELLLVGFIWLALTIGFEFLFGRFVVGLSWERITSDCNARHQLVQHRPRFHVLSGLHPVTELPHEHMSGRCGDPEPAAAAGAGGRGKGAPRLRLPQQYGAGAGRYDGGLRPRSPERVHAPAPLRAHLSPRSA